MIFCFVRNVILISVFQFSYLHSEIEKAVCTIYQKHSPHSVLSEVEFKTEIDAQKEYAAKVFERLVICATKLRLTPQ